MRLIKIAAVATLSSVALGLTGTSASAVAGDTVPTERVERSLRADNTHSASGISIGAAVKQLKESGHWGEVKKKAKKGGQKGVGQIDRSLARPGLGLHPATRGMVD